MMMTMMRIAFVVPLYAESIGRKVFYNPLIQRLRRSARRGNELDRVAESTAMQ